MLRHKNIDRICAIVLAATLLLTCGFMGAASLGLVAAADGIGYENRLFDQSRVHTIDIVMDDWDGFIETCTDEEYTSCTVVIDGEKYSNVAIRAKGNTSLSSVAAYGNNRYSFKLEFDHYQKGKTYYGLDKLCLNNIIQDKTYMKDYLAYTLMARMGVVSPLCSFVQINVNGSAWGLYLAVEGVEDGFLMRNYGKNSGNLYKPDSLSFGGGRGNGAEFNMDDFRERLENGGDAEASADGFEMPSMPNMSNMSPPDGFTGGSFAPPDMNADTNANTAGDSGANADTDASESSSAPDFGNMKSRGNFGGGMGSDDVKLQYIDDDPDSYSNIFDSAKTDISESDKERLIASLKTLSEGNDVDTVVDVEQVIRYFVVHDFLCNGDSYTGSMVHNYYLYEKDGVLSMIPWDYNLAFGAFSMGGSGSADGATSTVNSPIDSPVSSGDIESRPMIAWIFASEEYTNLYHEIYAEFIEEICTSGWLEEEIDRVSDMIAPYVENDTNGFFTYDEFVTGVSTLKLFCEKRAQSISGQLDGTIPSTTQGQSEDSSALIDASDINLGDMGEFSGGGGNSHSFGKGNRPSFDSENNSADADESRPEQPSNTVVSADDNENIVEQSAQSGDASGEESLQTEQATDSEQQGETEPNKIDLPENTDFAANADLSKRGDDSRRGKSDFGVSFTSDTGDFTGSASSSSDNTYQMLLFAGSVLVLLAGIIFAWRFKSNL